MSIDGKSHYSGNFGDAQLAVARLGLSASLPIDPTRPASHKKARPFVNSPINWRFGLRVGVLITEIGVFIFGPRLRN
jgi:hypothetical protein